MMHDDEKAQAFDGPLPIPYTAEEVGRTFADLLATFDFAVELHELGIGSLSLFKRRQAKKRFTALCIALWHVALEKSFPNDADAFFTHFVATYPPLVGERRGAKKMRDLVMQYDALVAEKKDGDFTKVADTITETFKLEPAEQRKQQLKLSLRIRSIYDLIFEKLI
ncbi:hypothetical protein LJC26_05215 [Desulfovibrio sp. OttesenSCG-928-O18]|nr:hypothetical protein [Desulfovibrio sp. OttesenSCG-928-O18]